MHQIFLLLQKKFYFEIPENAIQKSINFSEELIRERNLSNNHLKQKSEVQKQHINLIKEIENVS